jgi:UDP-N-acetylmuramyl tripeptide synthase
MPEALFFPYFGPGRRSDLKVIEIRLDFSHSELDQFPQQVPRIQRALANAGILAGSLDSIDGRPGHCSRNDYAALLARTALLFQQASGHEVEHCQVVIEPETDRCIALLEYEHPGVGMEAVKLAIALFSGKVASLEQAWRSFAAFARERKLPVETRAIMRIARQRDIPVYQMDHEPFSDHMKAGFHLRPNGLLMLGHGASTSFLDGTYCLNRSGERLNALLKNPAQRKALLQGLGYPTAACATEPGNVGAFHFLVVNRNLHVLEEKPGGELTPVPGEVHGEFRDMALKIAQRVGNGPVVIGVGASDIARPFAQSGGHIKDFDLAPDLGRLCGSDVASGMLDVAVGDLVDWLFPVPRAARMPIIAVTGTNGKTTTSRMLNTIMRAAGQHPGLVCTDGIYVDNRQISRQDASSFIGHARVLTNSAVNVAVLEAHHRGIAIRGFAFDYCDVGVCLNVTHEHIKKGEIESVEEMATIKRAVLERARHAAVLFADDEHCMAMPGFIRAEKVCLVSLQRGAGQLRGLFEDERGCFCVLETIADQAWIVLYDLGTRLPIMPVADIPATFDGAARFNVSNAMHAIAAAFFAGVDIPLIATGMRTFRSDQDNSPGRMNVYENLPFRIIIDFAHNPDGIAKVCEFIDQQQVEGRKLIAFAGMAKRSDDNNRRMAQAAAGHFDFYFCKDYAPSESAKQRLVAGFMRQVLIEEGIPAHQTTVLKYGREDMYRIFDACRPGDLLLLLLGHVEIHAVPGYIEDYAARH